jgi:hypothetical protein
LTKRALPTFYLSPVAVVVALETLLMRPVVAVGPADIF